MTIVQTPPVEQKEETMTEKKTKAPKKKGAVTEVAAPVTPAAPEVKPAPVDPRKKTSADIEARMAEIAARYEFLPDHKEEFGQVPVADIHIVPGLDSRAHAGVLDAPFLESLKKPDGSPNLIEPVVLAWAKDKQTGKIIRIAIAGRRRTAGFGQLGFTHIDGVTRGRTLQEAMIDAGIENLRRSGLSPWDQAVYMQSLKALGMAQNEIALRLGIAQSNVTQTLSLLNLDKRVQDLAKSGKMGPGAPTIGRELAKVEDLDQQYNIALKVIADPNAIWSAADVQAYVKDLNDRQAAAAKKKQEKEREKKKAAKEAKARGEAPPAEEEEEEEEEGPSFQFDRDEFVPLDVPTLHHLVERTFASLQTMKTENEGIIAALKASKEQTLLKYAEEQGILKGLKMASSLLKVPKAVEAAVAAEAEEEEEEEPEAPAAPAAKRGRPKKDK